jgi:hypothetical protein
MVIDECKAMVEWILVGIRLGNMEEFDVRGSVHHSTIHKEKPTRCNNVSTFYYSIFI